MSEAKRQILALGLMIQVSASHRQAKGNAHAIDIGHKRENVDRKPSQARNDPHSVRHVIWQYRVFDATDRPSKALKLH